MKAEPIETVTIHPEGDHLRLVCCCCRWVLRLPADVEPSVADLIRLADNHLSAAVAAADHRGAS